MKKVLYILCLLSFFACKKKKVNAVVIVTVVNHGVVIPNAEIYMKKGTLGYPNILPAAYDLHLTADASGQAVFENLSADNYYFYSTAQNGTAVYNGGMEINIQSAVAPNRREIKLFIE